MSKTYLLAGASSAIAKETANLLKKKGHRVIGISLKDPDPMYNAFYKVEHYDFSTFPKIDEPIDGLVYYPGTINLKPFSRVTVADIIEDLQINTLGAVGFVQTYLNNIKKSSTGSIVFLSSVAATTGLPYHTSISLAKGALESFSKALAAELAPSIRVNVVAPGLLNSPLSEKLINTPEKLESMKKRNPLRKVGDPLDVAYAVSFLLSSESEWITGQVIAVDGGMSNLKN